MRQGEGCRSGCTWAVVTPPDDRRLGKKPSFVTASAQPQRVRVDSVPWTGCRLTEACGGSKLDFGHVGNEPRQQLPRVTIGQESFLDVRDKMRRLKTPTC
jgi:hypothetical protein